MIKEYIIKIDKDQSKKDIYGGYPLIEPPLELVRCKDCKRKDLLSCPKAPKRPDDWFCADGEVKQDGRIE